MVARDPVTMDERRKYRPGAAKRWRGSTRKPRVAWMDEKERMRGTAGALGQRAIRSAQPAVRESELAA